MASVHTYMYVCTNLPAYLHTYVQVYCILFYFIYFSHHDTVASSILSITSDFFTPNATMEFHDVVVICDINPTSTAEFCEVLARNDDPRVTNRESMLSTYLCVCTYTHNNIHYMYKNRKH